MFAWIESMFNYVSSYFRIRAPLLPPAQPAPSLVPETELPSNVIHYDNENWGDAWGVPKSDPSPEQLEQPKHKGPQPGVTRGKYDTQTGKLRDDIADHMDDVTERLSSLFNLANKSGLSPRDIELLESTLGSDFLLYSGGDIVERPAPGDRFSEESDRDLAETVWPVNFGFVGYYSADKYNASKDDDTERVPGLRMQWVQTTTAKEARGKVKRTAPKMLHVMDIKLGDNGAWWIYDYYAGLIGNMWVPLDDGMEYERQTGIFNVKGYTRKPHASWMRDIIREAMNSQLSARYHWHVAFGTEPGPRVILPTNPTACLKLFRDRELVEGETRRAALRHWVTNHYANHEEAGSIYIRDHLRGHTNFRWANFPCEIMVSAYDLEKNEYFKNQVNEWRAQRKHNSVRVRVKKK